MDKSDGPPIYYCYRSFAAKETHGVKLPPHRFCADVNGRASLDC